MSAGVSGSMREGILALMVRYGQCADRVGGAQGWRSCFVDDAVVTSFSPRRDRSPAVLTGCAAIERAFTATGASDPTTHVTANVVVEFDGMRAALQSVFVRFDHVADAMVVVGSFGRYRDRVVLCPDGLWRFTEREIHLISRRRPTPAT